MTSHSPAPNLPENPALTPPGSRAEGTASSVASQRPRTALIMAAGTGGHIFPGLAVAEALRARGWAVQWLGTKVGMEQRIVPARGITLHAIEFGGVRGKGWKTLLKLPFKLLAAIGQARAAISRVRPDVVVGFGGYVTAPGGMAARLARVPLIIHEQNAVAGTANRWLAKMAEVVCTAFPNVLPSTRTRYTGNPLRSEHLSQPEPQQRFANRSGPLRILVLGGSLGAQALNETIPQAIALLPSDQRPHIVHQSGEKHLQALQAAYAAAGVQAQTVAFIDDTASAMAAADLIICRAGASTVTEIAAVGAAAIFVPLPHAIDDHQTANACFLADAGAAWLVPQSTLTPEALAQRIAALDRAQLLQTACAAHEKAQREASQQMVEICEKIVAKT